MKKIWLFFLLMFVMPISVNANTIHSINIDVYLNSDGTANITEVWDVDGTDGTEWYKVINNLGNMRLSDFTVSMDGRNLEYKNWNVSESLYQKRGYYGINYTSEGLELCFGKYDYNRHRFTLNYKLTNFIFNTGDSQVLYFKFIDRLSSVDFDDFSVTISSYYSFPDTLDVWGYGYKGYAYVSNGKIEMSNEENSDMEDKYTVLLVKFPLNTFSTTNFYSQFSIFDDIYNKAEENTFDYNYDGDVNVFELIFIFIINFIMPIVLFVVIFLGSRGTISREYGYVNNKKIDKKNVPMFRDIPCNKDIYYANVLVMLNNFGYKESNILGAIILKWIRDKKIVFKKITTEVGNAETSVIDLTGDVIFDNDAEKQLFDLMKFASIDGLLEAKELEKCCRSNYSVFFNVMKKIQNDALNSLKANGHIYARTSKEECKCHYVMDDTMYKDSIELYGLKKYLEEFSRMDKKEVMEVMLWDEYLMFAYLFGIADKVTKQLKNMYPEILEQYNYDYDTLVFINHISTRTVSSASSARSAATSYSSGGGGFSSGGGGGGSFGGGGGGSR